MTISELIKHLTEVKQEAGKDLHVVLVTTQTKNNMFHLEHKPSVALFGYTDETGREYDACGIGWEHVFDAEPPSNLIPQLNFANKKGDE